MYYLLYYNIYPKLQRICIISFPVVCLLMLYLLYHFIWNKYVIASSFFYCKCKKKTKKLACVAFPAVACLMLTCLSTTEGLSSGPKMTKMMMTMQASLLLLSGEETLYFDVDPCSLLRKQNLQKWFSGEATGVCSSLFTERERESILLLLFHSVMLMLNS